MNTAKNSVQNLLPGISAGLVNGVLIVIFQSAYAALIFSGSLASHLDAGLGMMLFGACVMGLIVALTSSFEGTVTAPQDAPTAIMALVAASIASVMTYNAGSDEVFLTLIGAIAITSLITGIVLTLLGRFQLGNMIRFIPYPVVGGFLAGTGWILVKGAIGIMAGSPLAFNPALLNSEVLLRWLPGVLFAFALFFALRRFKHFLMMPGIILATICLFYAILWLVGSTVSEAADFGLLLPALDSGIVWRPLMPTDLAKINWGVILGQSGELLTIMVISIISLLLNASGLELIARREVDLNQELRSTGLANIVSGIGGSSVGYMSLSLSAFGFRLGSRNRISSFISAGLCGIVLLTGIGVSSYFPKPLLGGLLFYLGLTFLVDWLYSAWFKLPKMEYFLVVAILLTIAMFGFLQGTILGILIAVVLFVINYSRIEVVKHSLTGENYRSNVDRSLRMQHILEEQGVQIEIMKLQGFIFFGTANGVLHRVRERAFNIGLAPLRYVLLDFRLVSGLDSSALNSFAKLKMLAENQSFQLVLTSLSDQTGRLFYRGALVESEDPVIRVLPDLDHGLEWIEDEILEISDDSQIRIERSGPELLAEVLQLSGSMGAEAAVKVATDVMPFVETRSFKDGEYLIVQGAAPSGIYILESGQVTVQLEKTKTNILRLRRMNPGTVVGELGVYLNYPATAAVVANQPSHTLFISLEALQKMEREDPAIAAAFHKFIVQILGERLSNSNKTLQAVLD
ncbi:MAG: SLC26A/SulP transporter family protein [Calditrichia bacterium]